MQGPRGRIRILTAERRRSPRADITLNCTLIRPGGTIASALTVDVSPAGARVLTAGALQLDEVVGFEFPADGRRAFLGQARVTREHAAGVYGMRFERMAESDRRELWEMAAGAALH